MPLFPGHEPPSVKKIILYIVIILVVMAVFAHFFPGESPFVES